MAESKLGMDEPRSEEVEDMHGRGDRQQVGAPPAKKRRGGKQKKSEISRRQELNRAIRHKWMADWFVNVVNIGDIEDEYATQGDPLGYMMFVQFLIEKGKEALIEMVAKKLDLGDDVDGVTKDESALLEWCKQAALNWKREWCLWMDSQEQKDWVATSEGEQVWSELSIDPSFVAKRESLATEVQGWFNVVTGSLGRISMRRGATTLLLEPITESSLTPIRRGDLFSSWDDGSRLRSDGDCDYHIVRYAVIF
ncbi:unnamed protein product [Calypogeia fissa]